MTGRVLVLRALGLGDLMASVPALRALRRTHPGAEIALAAPAPVGDLAVATGLADTVVPVAPLAPLPPGTRAGLAVNLHGRGPESHRVVLGCGGSPGIVAFAHPGVWSDGPAWDDAEHERERWCRLLRWAGIPADPADVRLPAPPAPASPADGPPVIVHPGAAAGARRWPAERFAAVARAVHPRHPVIVTGSAAERPLAAAVARGAGLPPVAVTAGATDLIGLARLVAGARAVVSGDTGIAHLAVALGIPTVTVFGPMSPALWGPPADPRHRVLWAGLTGDSLGDVPGPGLLAVTPGEVTAALHAVLEGPPQASPPSDPLSASMTPVGPSTSRSIPRSSSTSPPSAPFPSATRARSSPRAG